MTEYKQEKPLIDRIKPGKVTRQEYAERPFDFFTLKQGGRDIIIEESYNWETDKPRVVKVQGYRDPSIVMERVAIKVTDGLFTKDLLMKENEYNDLMRAFPSTLNNLKGVIFKITKGAAPLYDAKIEYIRCDPKMVDHDRSNYPKPADQKAEMPKQLSDYAIMLGNAVKQNNLYGIPTSIQVLTKMADTIYPNRALDVIQAAKAAGLIYEQNNEYKAV